jgi:enoyl-CoA hydratase/carnithine racemase
METLKILAQGWIMNLFSFNTIFTQLNREKKCLIVTLNRPERFNQITLETLFELETILNWAYPRTEICSIVINSNQGLFSKGLEDKNLKAVSAIKLRNALLNLHKAMIRSTQIIVFDFGEKVQGIAFEMALAADLWISSNELEVNPRANNHPILYSHHLFRNIHGHALLRNLFLKSKIWNSKKLVQLGLLYETYKGENKDQLIYSLLTGIAEQSAMLRSQTKLYQLHELSFKKEILRAEEEILRATLEASAPKINSNKPIADKGSRKDQLKMTLIDGGLS